MLPAFCSWLHEEQPTSTSLHIALQSSEVLCVLKQITSLIAESGLNMGSPKSAGLRCLLRSCLRRRQVIDTATDFALPGIGVSAACACKRLRVVQLYGITVMEDRDVQFCVIVKTLHDLQSRLSTNRCSPMQSPLSDSKGLLSKVSLPSWAENPLQ